MEEKAKSILNKYNQEHIIRHLESLNREDKDKLIKQILDIDFEEVKDLYDRANSEAKKKDVKITPIEAVDSDDMEIEKKEEYINIGEEVLKNNKFAAVTMSGGQGTRLRT